MVLIQPVLLLRITAGKWNLSYEFWRLKIRSICRGEMNDKYFLLTKKENSNLLPKVKASKAVTENQDTKWRN